MPYKTVSELPSEIKDNLPPKAQEVWRKVFNSAYNLYQDDAKSAKVAWQGIKEAGYRKNELDNWVKKSYQVPIEKIDEEKRQVFGWANVSQKWVNGQLETVVDSHEDTISPEELETTAYRFAKLYREGGEMHLKGNSAIMIESMVFTMDKQKALGIPNGIIPVGWWIGFEVIDENAWQGIKNGFYRAFSIEGAGIRTNIDERRDQS